MDPLLLSRWPGKSADPNGICHSAILHMLEVAAVAEVLVPALPHPVRQAMLLLTALHDLGKISDSYRAMLQTGAPQIAGRHWEVSEAYFYLHDDLLASALGGRFTARQHLYAASAGHHGRPPDKDLSFDRDGKSPARDLKRMRDAAGPQAIADAAEVIRAFLPLWPGASLDSLTLAEAKALSWRLAGLITAADWIGSNNDWFPSSDNTPDLATYLEQARERAAFALDQAGLHPPAPRADRLFSFDLRPMQQACATVPLPDGPMLAVIEDETGSGKTEAALVLAQRMLCAGKASALYFALPTMATADAMFARVETVVSALFKGAPSVTLAHGRAGLSARFRDLALVRDLNPDEPGPTAWLRDNRRRALLATVGVGTVDQALMAAVRAKHAPLRQFGLSTKILIVDEAHEMGDPYMGALLEALLNLHAAQGGSAILMSATLDLGLRNRLVSAFETGAGRTPVSLDDPAYPALSLPGAASPALSPRPSPRGPVLVNRVPDADTALSILDDAAARGAACVWVRNAVDEAISALSALRDRGVKADLLHARFTLHDRNRHESAALATFGKDRAALPGRVLVATQVVESSLDLDFDVMVSDLAPVAALVQRAGRLWRHIDRRPQGARPVNAPVLHVLSPDPAAVDHPGWARAELGRGAYVYPVADLWRSAAALFKAGEIRAPEGLRALVEAVALGAEVPEPLVHADLKNLGQQGAAKTHAGQNRIDRAAGYRTGGAGAQDADYPTRLGVPQKVLVLMRNGLPWAGGEWKVDSCQLSEVSASASRLDKLPIPPSPPPPGLPDWLVNSRIFVEVAPDGRICEGLRYDADLGLLFD